MDFVPTSDLSGAGTFQERVPGLRVEGRGDFALALVSGGIPVRVAKVKELPPQLFTILQWKVVWFKHPAGNVLPVAQFEWE